MLELNKENFEQEVKGQEGLVIVDWWGPRCAPCLALMPRMEALATKYTGQVKFTKVNVNENRRLAIAERVMGLPTLTLYRNGEVIDSWSADQARPEAIEEKLASLLS